MYWQLEPKPRRYYRMKRILSSLPLLFILAMPLVRSSAQAADTVGAYLYTITGVAKFSVTPLQQLLAIDSTGLLRLYDAQGTSLFQYHNTVAGDAVQIDATDPFNLLLFFPEQQSIVLLDRTLSDRAMLDLRTTDVIHATAVARSHDNNIWIYDEPAGRLLLLDERGHVIRSSNDLRLSDGISQGATHILRHGQSVWLYFPEHAVAVFDLLGQLQAWWDIPALDDCFQHEGQFYYRHEGQYFQFSPRQQRSTPVATDARFTTALLRRQLDRWYLLDTNGLLKVLSSP